MVAARHCHHSRLSGAVSANAQLAAAPPAAAPGAHGGIALRAVDRFAESLVIAALLGELGLVLANVFARAWLHHSFLWADEVARLALATLAFVGGAVAYRRRDHACVRVILNFFPKRAQDILFAFADVVVLFVSGLTGIASFEFIASSWNERTPVLQLPAAVIAMPLPAGMALIEIGRAHV